MYNSANYANSVIPDRKGRRRKLIIIWSCVIISICALLVLILVPLSFSTIEYYEYGLEKGRNTGQVSLDNIYGAGGRYALGPDKVFQTYQADSHVVVKTNVSVVTSDKLETNLDIVILYFIQRENLPKLQREFNLRYETVVESRILSSIKNQAVNFTTLQYFQELEGVELAMLNSVKLDVEKSIYVDIPLLYITGLRIPSIVANKQLETAIQNEVNSKQLYINQAADIRKETETQVNNMNNNATLTRQISQASAVASIDIAGSQSRMRIEKARILSIQHMFKSLNITNEVDKQELDYMLSLLKSPDLHLRIGYQPLLVNSVSSNVGISMNNLNSNTNAGVGVGVGVGA
jgi:hypothetical protein